MGILKSTTDLTTITLKKYVPEEEEKTSRNRRKDEVGDCLRTCAYLGHQCRRRRLVLSLRKKPRKICIKMQKNQMRFLQRPLRAVHRSFKRMGQGGRMPY